jgi:hypothetical protein
MLETWEQWLTDNGFEFCGYSNHTHAGMIEPFGYSSYYRQRTGGEIIAHVVFRGSINTEEEWHTYNGGTFMNPWGAYEAAYDVNPRTFRVREGIGVMAYNPRGLARLTINRNAETE